MQATWIVPLTRRDRPVARLVCFPHGGGSPSAFRNWGEGLPDWLDILCANPPGRAARFREPPVDRLTSAVDGIVSDLAPYLDAPVVLFGHSAGALMAFETARRLEQDRSAQVLHVMVSGLAAPDLRAIAPPLHDVADDALYSMLNKFGLLPPEVLEVGELRALMLSAVRNDFRMCETHSVPPDAALNAPLTAIGGSDDDLVDQNQLAAWQVHTRSRFSLSMFPGGHFFTETASTEVLKLLSQTVQAELDALPKSLIIGATEAYPVETCLHELFRNAAAKTPQATALVGTDRDLTFGDLDRESDLLARELVRLGVSVDRLVAIFLETSVDFVVAYLAALKAGSAYLPIPLTTPAGRIGEIVQKAGPYAIVTRGSLAERFPQSLRSDARVVRLDHGWQDRLSRAGLPQLSDVLEKPGPDSLAYCVMSSGTTGEPKGILCPHRGAVNSYWWRFVHLPYGDAEREACNVFFVWEVLRPLLQGRPAYVIPDEVIFDPKRLIAFLEQHEITRVLFTASLFEQVLGAVATLPGVPLRSLRMVILNGEVVTRALRDRARVLLPHVCLINDYSISECHDITTSDLNDANAPATGHYMPAGHVMANVRVYILDEARALVPRGVTGEIYVAGPTLARGYLGLPDETAVRFLPDPFQGGDARMFRTGDVGRQLPCGQIEIKGRTQFMVKLRGYTIVPSAVVADINAHPDVAASVVVTIDNPETGQPDRLAAYVTTRTGAPDEAFFRDLRSFLKLRLPAYAIPADWVGLNELPLSASTGKVDAKSLPAPPAHPPRQTSSGSTSGAELKGDSSDPTGLDAAIRTIWGDVLNRVPEQGSDNFFDLGGHSLLAVELADRVETEFGAAINVIDVFHHPTFAEFARHVASKVARVRGSRNPAFETRTQSRPRQHSGSAMHSTDIAVVGLSCRLPGASSPEGLWSNLIGRVDSVRRLTSDELHALGVDDALISDPAYVRAAAMVDDVELFDPAYFGISDREATLMDPQHRLFIECAWEAMERAGLRSGSSQHKVGVFAGCYLPSYLIHHLGASQHLGPGDPTRFHLAEIGNDKDYLCSRTAYLLDLRGPAVSVQTSCSTGLVAIAQAAQAIRAGQCDVALAGAASLIFPRGGYKHVDGHVSSRSGYCRPFDADGDGTVLGDGVGAVVLRRLEDALSDGAVVLAVIKGFAVNNDGASRAGYSAPGVRGQVEVISAALDDAGISPATIGYVEAHGTATRIGDPIEVRALTEAWCRHADLRSTCAIGSIKANIGHANIAAGVAGFIKTVLALHQRQIPPQIHFARENPELRLSDSPFRIVTEAEPWECAETSRRRAAVSSFGIGGTNAHVILEEAPAAYRSPRNPVAPVLPFRRRRCWPDDMDASKPSETPVPAAPDQRLPWQDRFYVRSSARLPAADPSGPGGGAPQRWIVVSGPAEFSRGIGDMLARRLTAVVSDVSRFALRDWDEDLSGLEPLLSAARSGQVVGVLWCGAIDASDADAIDPHLVLMPLFRVMQRLIARKSREPLTLVAATCNALAVPGQSADPCRSAVVGPLITLAQEDPTITARLVDISTDDVLTSIDEIADRIVAECTASASQRMPHVALRRNGVFAERFDPFPIGEVQQSLGRRRLLDGPHVITGGLGRIGLTLARYLAGLGADVLLLSRSPLPSRDRWQDLIGNPDTNVALRNKLAALLAAEALAGRCYVHTLDVTDANALSRLMSSTADRYGRLGGIFHAAGLAHLQDLSDVTGQSLADELAPKVAGTLAIKAAIQHCKAEVDRTPSFVMLFSSLAATLGGLGLGAYAAANRFQDAFVEAEPVRDGVTWASVAWDDWAFDYGDQQQAAYSHTRVELSLPPQEGIAAIEAILGEPGLSNVLVSATALRPRWERWVQQKSADVAIRSEPNVSQMNPGYEPSLETLVLAAYRKVLGKRELGLNDNFFELGGDSLLATEIVLELMPGVKPGSPIRIADVFEYPSVRALASYLELLVATSKEKD